MFRTRLAWRPPALGFPRIRGDVPVQIMGNTGETPFSPHTRGCSADILVSGSYFHVFPAYAGMFRYTYGICEFGGGFPRIRGDVPDAAGLGYGR